MAELQAWFQPLLWIFGVVGAFGGFYKLVFPCLKEVSETPKQLKEAIQGMNLIQQGFQAQMEDIKIQLTDMSNKIDKVGEIEIHLLHDAILGIYADAKREGKISESSYRRAQELYSMNGKNEYIKSIMDELTDMHRVS